MSELIGNKQTPPKKAALGRGLGSLLGESSAVTKEEKKPEAPVATPPPPPVEKVQPVVAAPVVPEHARIWQLAIEKIVRNEGQPRQHFDKQKLDELALSIKQKGVLQPILVKRVGANYEIIAGERRWRAAQLAGLKEIPALIKNFEEQDSYEVALIENIQRHDLNPVEEAEAYQYLMKTYNMTQQLVAEKVGKDRATVANILRLLQLPDQVRQMVIKNELSLGHAKVLMSLTNPQDQVHFAEKAVREKLSVRLLEKLVALQIKKTEEKNQPGPSAEDLLKAKMAKSAVENLQKKIGSKLQLEYHKAQGSLKIHFYSDQEFNELIECLQNIRKNNG